MPKDFISFLDFTPTDLTMLLDRANTLREAWQAKRLPQHLAGKTAALIWDAEGFRNRVSFELGIAALGGIEEASEDTIAYLGHQVYAAKAYLLHAQNAVLATLL